MNLRQMQARKPQTLPGGPPIQAAGLTPTVKDLNSVCRVIPSG